MAAVAPAYAALVPPPGYYAAVGQKNKGASCPTPPPPFTDTLDFPSKYEGSGKSRDTRSEEHTSELQSLMRISYAVFCLKKKKKQHRKQNTTNTDTQEHNTKQ